MCKITDEMVRIAKKYLRNNSIEKIEKEYSDKLASAQEIEDPVARNYAIKIAEQLRSDKEESYKMVNLLLIEYGKATNGRSRKTHNITA